MNIIEQIGRGKRFGVLLMNDERGTTLESVDDEDPYFEIMQRWIRGGGRTPVTWETLVEVLKEAGLKQLASEIESSLL